MLSGRSTERRATDAERRLAEKLRSKCKSNEYAEQLLVNHREEVFKELRYRMAELGADSDILDMLTESFVQLYEQIPSVHDQWCDEQRGGTYRDFLEPPKKYEWGPQSNDPLNSGVWPGE